MMSGVFALAQANLLSPPVLFFILGLAGTLAGSRLTLPEQVAKAIAVYLMLSIGFKGGAAVAGHGIGGALVPAVIAGTILSAALPLVAFALLSAMGRGLPVHDRAAVAAHYGSISIVTFVAATEAVRVAGFDQDGFMVAVAAVMETPAIMIGLWLARRSTPRVHDKADSGGESLLGEVLLNSSIVVLTGAFVIGILTGEKGMADIGPFIVDPFKGVLCLFLLDMGAVAGRGLRSGGKVLGTPLILFGLIMPVISATLALPLAMVAGLETGSAALLMTLAASASYIAVPAAMRIALPEANPSVYLTLSLGITFPFNLVVGIPVYTAAAAQFAGG